MSSAFRGTIYTALLALAAVVVPVRGQKLNTFESAVPFGLRMAFFRGPADSTRCIITFAVENQSLLFFRETDHFSAAYEAFLSMRDSDSRSLVRGLWHKDLAVPSYDETTLQQRYDPLQEEINVSPGKYEGFAEIKDLNSHTYGNGRVSVNVPDLSNNLPKLSTPFFYDTKALGKDSLQLTPGDDSRLKGASLQYASGEPIFLLVEVYADSARPPVKWKLTAEVVKALMVFPRVEVPLQDGVLKT